MPISPRRFAGRLEDSHHSIGQTPKKPDMPIGSFTVSVV